MKFFQDQARQLAVLLGLIAAAIVLYYAGWLRPFEHWVSTAAQPAMSLAYATIDSFSPLYSTTDTTLLAENRTLKDQLSSVVQQNSALQTELQQYTEYKEELDFAQQSDYTLQPAKITTRIGTGAVGQTLYINVGQLDGLQPGYAVIYGPGMLLGIITNVHESYSEVGLLTNDASSVQGRTQTEAHTSGVVIGQFGTSLLMQYILKEQQIAVGDLIVTNGQDHFIPAGLIIGTVEAIADEPSDLFKTATISPMVRYGNNAIVSIVIPTGI